MRPKGHVIVTVRCMPSSRRHDEGAIAVLVAVLTPVLLLVVGLVIAMGLVYSTHQKAVNAADAAADTAGIVMLTGGDPEAATEQAESIAATNYGTTPADWAACTDPAAYDLHPVTPCVSFDLTARRVRVVTPARVIQVPGIPQRFTVRVVSGATWTDGVVALFLPTPRQ